MRIACALRPRLTATSKESLDDFGDLALGELLVLPKWHLVAALEVFDPKSWPLHAFAAKLPREVDCVGVDDCHANLGPVNFGQRPKMLGQLFTLLRQLSDEECEGNLCLGRSTLDLNKGLFMWKSVRSTNLKVRRDQMPIGFDE